MKKAIVLIIGLSLAIFISLRVYQNISRTREQVTATAATRKFQEEKFRAETEKFKVGKSTTLLVAQTQRDLVAGRISEIKAMGKLSQSSGGTIPPGRITSQSPRSFISGGRIRNPPIN